MQNHFYLEEAAQFLRNARMGCILTPDQLRAELRHVQQLPDVGSYAVESCVPNWLVEKLDPTQRLAHKYVVFPTVDRLDTVLLATMQSGNVQLRCVMQLSDPLANAFLTDALNEKVFTLLFRVEGTRQCAVMSVPMEFDEPDTLRGLLRNARRSVAGIAPAIQLTSFNCSPAFSPSLIEGRDVEDVIAVLATAPTPGDLEMVFGDQGHGDADKRGGTVH